MSSSRVPVNLLPRTLACHAVTEWDSESALLGCSFEYGADEALTPASVAERIEASLGISRIPRRAVLGAVDVTWRDERRLLAIEVRTARSDWQPASLGTPSVNAGQSWMWFGLAHDVNRFASRELDVSVLWDGSRSCFALRFSAADPVSCRWAAIADSVFACVDGEQRLIELRFEDVQVSSGQPPS
jgi:hypothetical protein